MHRGAIEPGRIGDAARDGTFDGTFDRLFDGLFDVRCPREF